MNKDVSGEPEFSTWMNLGPVHQAREWEEFRPGTFEQMFALVVHDAEYRRAQAETRARHERRLDYIAVGLQLARLIFALAAVIIIALTARYYADHNAPNQGVKVFGLGAGSIVAAFIGTSFSPMVKRLTRKRNRTRVNQ
jgi:hypothetical protein